MAELVDEPLGALRLLHDALLVVLPEGAAELVVVHGRAVLALAPERGHAVRVDDLEDALNGKEFDSRPSLLGLISHLNHILVNQISEKR